MHEFLIHAPLLLAAAFAAGVLNAVAGGGSFLTLPALILAGLPPVAANATGTVALLPGYASSTLASREDLREAAQLPLTLLVVASLGGGALGAALPVLLPGRAFEVLIPWLLLVATVAFALAPRVIARQRAGRMPGRTGATLAVFGVAVYGGYFNGGVGIVLLALFALLGVANFNAANALKNLVSLLLTAIAVVVYAGGGAVAWPQALLMAVAATAGGWIGSRLIRRVPARYVRYAVIAIGAAMTALFFRY